MQLDEQVAFLEQLDLFAGLDATELLALAGAMHACHLERGQLLALEADPCTMVYFVVQGRLRAFKMSRAGREQVVGVFLPGQPFYLVPALDGGLLPLSTQADTRCILLATEASAFVELLRRQPAVLMAVAVSLTRRLRQMTGLVEDLALRTVSQRVARLLLARLEASAPHRLTQQQMAAQLGTVREVVARTLATFCQRGWIDMQRGRIEIRDLDGLSAEAE